MLLLGRLPHRAHRGHPADRPVPATVADPRRFAHPCLRSKPSACLYLNLVRHESVARNVTLAILIVPILFHRQRDPGDGAHSSPITSGMARGRAASAAGMVLFMDLLLIIVADSLIREITRRLIEVLVLNYRWSDGLCLTMPTAENGATGDTPPF